MQTRDKIVITVLMIAIFFVTGGIACNYFNTYVIDPILTVMLGILVFVDAGAIMCSRSKSTMAI
jgi:Co/Zn/Cd efflux system component